MKKLLLRKKLEIFFFSLKFLMNESLCCRIYTLVLQNIITKTHNERIFMLQNITFGFAEYHHPSL